MSQYSCLEIADLLVDFADDNLATAQRQAVAAHLADCPDCRRTLAALQQSLSLAQTLWEDAEGQIESRRGNSPVLPTRQPRNHGERNATLAFQFRRRVVLLAPVAIAAGLVLLLIGHRFWKPAITPHQPDMARKDASVQPLQPAGPQVPLISAVAWGTPPDNYEDPQTALTRIELDVDRAAQAAMVLAATDTCLADQPGCEDLAKDQYAFVATTYAGTEAATKARQRLESISERRTLQ